MNNQKAAAWTGLAVFAVALGGAAAGEIINPKVVNDFGKGLVFISATASGTSTGLIQSVPNAVGGAHFDAPPWHFGEDLLARPAFRVTSET